MDPAVSLSVLEVMVIDCQATAAAPRGQLLELGWARVGPAASGPPRATLVRLPAQYRVPPVVARMTGITDRMLRDGIAAHEAWRELADEVSHLDVRPAPAIAHFARFERAFLQSLGGDAPALDLVCTHEVARRLLPGLPRCGLRALSGYFGRGVGGLRRSTDHVEATAFVWRELVRLLQDRGVTTWLALHGWLEAPVGAPTRSRRVWPMPREVRLSLPHAPGLYRMLRTSGDVLYVGKAASLHDRVNSYFRKQHGVHERTLEMLSQARALSFDVTPSVLEAALLEADDIKRHRPPYNVALTDHDRCVWFATRDLGERRAQPSRRFRVGPLSSSPDLLDQFSALAQGEPAALGSGRWAPDAITFAAGLGRFRQAHRELAHAQAGARTCLLRLGTRLWHEGRRDRDADHEEAADPSGRRPSWTAESVQRSLEWLAIRAALAVRRARWLTSLVDAAVVWSEPGTDHARLIVIEHGDVVFRTSVALGTVPPLPPGGRRPRVSRQRTITLARFDRLRVLTTELKRLVGDGAPVAVRVGAAPLLAGERLARALSWV